MAGHELDRFIEAQERDYERALAEIRAGQKCTHWIWYVFPQLQGLGRSDYCHIYGIYGLEEATDYLANECLSERLVTISRALLELDTNDPVQVLGKIDARKVRSCMTLFALVEGADPVFRQVLDKFYDGAPDERTLELLGVAWPSQG